MKQFFLNAIRNFKASQKGSLSVEAVFAFPMLFWAATATFTFYDAFKAQNSSYRANYTISDMLSRETEEINQAYVDGLHKVFRYMTHTGPEFSWIRVSVIKCTRQCDDDSRRALRVVWSHSANGASSLNNGDMSFYNEKIPLVAKGDQLIFVETSREYKPPFAQALVSFAERNLVSHVTTRPRFAPQVLWSNS